MAETRASLIGIDLQVARFREESIDGIIAYPRRRLMALAKSPDLIRLIKVLEALAVGSRLGRPHVLGIRHSRSWESVAVRETEVRKRALQRIYIANQVGMACRINRQSTEQEPTEGGVQSHYLPSFTLSILFFH